MRNSPTAWKLSDILLHLWVNGNFKIFTTNDNENANYGNIENKTKTMLVNKCKECIY